MKWRSNDFSLDLNLKLFKWNIDLCQKVHIMYEQKIKIYIYKIKRKRKRKKEICKKNN